MNKRQFLAGAALAAGALPALAAKPAASAARGPVLLTLTGAVGKTNRGPFDPQFDQMMGKHKVKFDRAFTFDFAALARLPQQTITSTLEYDGKPHQLRGPLLADVLAAAGVKADNPRILLQAVDGYAVMSPLADLRRFGFIIAHEIDGKPLALGGIGPLWAVYDPGRFPELAAKTLPERFALCPWGIYHISVQTA